MEAYEALGAADGTSEADGAAPDGPAELAGVDGAASDGPAVLAGVDGPAPVGLVELAGVLQPTAAPPSEAATTRPSRIRLIMTEDSSIARAPAGPVPRVAAPTTSVDSKQRRLTIAPCPSPQGLQQAVIRCRPSGRSADWLLPPARVQLA